MNESRTMTNERFYSQKNRKEWTTNSGTRIIKIIGGRSNVFLISYDQQNILVDTGPGFMSRKLLNRLEKLKIRTIDYLILTHSHFDHAANASLIKDKFGARVIIHKSEADFLFSGDSPVPAGTNTFSSWLVRNFSQKLEKTVRYKSCQADKQVNDSLNLSSTGINIIHTPGHTPGSLSIIVDREIALVGDTMFGIFPGNCFPPFANDVTSLIKSWEGLINSGCGLFLPSHGWGRTIHELKQNLKSKKA